MVQTKELTIEFFSSGYCISHANIADPINGRGKAHFHAAWALLHHPEMGYMMFDTGYTKLFNNATNPFPERFYRWLTPCVLDEKDTALEILKRKGISPNEIKYIIISHFHADHIAGLKDFPNATFLSSKDAYNQVVELKGFRAISKAILHELIPENIDSRIKFIEDISTKSIDKSGLEVYDLFDKGILKLISLPGHAKGMLGFWANHFLYATDASWSYETFEKKILPKKIVKLFFDSWQDFLDSQQKLRIFKEQNPETKILFTHCPETLKFVKEGN